LLPTPPVVYTIVFNVPTNSIPLDILSQPLAYTLPSLPSTFSWSVQATATGGGGTPVSATQVLQGGATIYIYVGTPRVTFVPPVLFPPIPGIYGPGGAAGVATVLNFAGFPQSILVKSNGGVIDIASTVVLTLTSVPT